MAHQIGFKRLFSNAFERTVFNKLETWFLNDGAKVVHNCTIPWPSKGVTELDIIMIHRSGIYVLECKRWSGIITNEGNRYHKYIPHDDKDDYDEDCVNPFWQNYLHIKCLAKLLNRELGIHGAPFHSLVVFPDTCSIEGIHPVYENEHPVHLTSSMVKTIRRIDKRHGRVLGESQIKEIHDLLKHYEPATQEERLVNANRIRQQRNASFEKKWGSSYLAP
jgi:hypothetical protein